MEWASLLSAAADPATPSLVAPDLGFLGSSRFAAKTPDFGGWILLDFLGFSRENLDLSIGYADFSQFFLFPFLATDPPERRSPFGARKGRSCSSAQPNPLRIFRKKLLALVMMLDLFFRQGRPRASHHAAAPHIPQPLGLGQLMADVQAGVFAWMAKPSPAITEIRSLA
jgi:hypothetical protein